MTALVLATTRSNIADFADKLFLVYWILIIAYIVVQWYVGFGGRIPYSRAGSAVLEFLRDTVEPYLRIFRRFLPSFGGLDLSPMLAIFVLFIAQRVIVDLIRG
jgi:uncharacterized protein YggT (Ycf19 family)